MVFGLNPEKIRADFPILKKNIIYFDNACMSLKPTQVIDKINEYYKEYSSCAGRSSHSLSKRVDLEVLKSRDIIKKTINAKSEKEIIFTRNTTESINLVSNSLNLKKGDEIIITDKEHNSNLIPWLKLKERGIKVIICKSNEDNTFNLDNFKSCFSNNTKLVSISHVSNLDGVTNPIKEITKIAHNNKALVLIDGAQSFPNREIDVRSLDVDLFAFSGHKALGPTGTGVLYGKKEILENMSQFIVGGQTVIDSTYENFEKEEIPNKFEAGLQDYAGIIGLGEACSYLKKIGLGKIEKHEIKLNKLVSEELSKNNKIKLIGPEEPEKRSGIYSFNIEGINAHNISNILDSSNKIMVRSGAHCVHSWFNNNHLEGSARASFYLYNTENEITKFIEAINKISRLSK